MVMPLVRSIDQHRPTCFARSWLFKAHDSLQSGQLVQAGCELREAVRVLLESLCEAHACLPKGKGRRSARELLKAVQKAGHCTDFGAEVIKEAIDFGNKLAHCKRVPPNHLQSSIEFLHILLDGCDELELPIHAEGGRI